MSDHGVVMVTGGAQGIGRGEVEAFVAAGARVAVADVDMVAAQELAARWPERAVAVQLDVSDEEQWARAVAQIAGQLGPVSVLVNNAGVFARGEILATPVADFQRVLDINVVGTLLGIRAVASGMIENGGGAIITTASTAGTQGVMHGSAYSTSKWAVRGLTKSAALDLSVHNIRVNAIVPGIVETPAMRAAGFPGVLPTQAIGRAGQPAEIAALAVWLASPQASYVTGAEFVVDGGSTAGSIPQG